MSDVAVSDRPGYLIRSVLFMVVFNGMEDFLALQHLHGKFKKVPLNQRTLGKVLSLGTLEVGHKRWFDPNVT